MPFEEICAEKYFYESRCFSINERNLINKKRSFTFANYGNAGYYGSIQYAKFCSKHIYEPREIGYNNYHLMNYCRPT